MRAGPTGSLTQLGVGTLWRMDHTWTLLVYTLEISKELCHRCFPAAALAKSVKSYADLHFGLYFSHFEWFNPLYLQDKANNYTTQTYVKVCTIPQS